MTWVEPLISDNLAGIPATSLNVVFGAILDFLLLSLRVGSFLLAAPFFGSRMVPLNIRIILTFSLAFFLYGWVEVPNINNLNLLGIFSIITVELAIGLTAGLIFAIAFSSVSLAGEKIAATSGLSFALQVDPSTGTQSPVISQFLTLFLLMIFFATDSHLIAFNLILQSYATVPIGAKVEFERFYQTGFIVSEDLFQNAAIIMLPVVGVLFLINLAVGIITRSAPQLNLFSFGFPITILSVMFLLYLSVPPFAAMFVNLIEDHIILFSDLIAEVSNGRK